MNDIGGGAVAASDDPQLLCVIPGPSKELTRREDRVRWCFKCRAHLMHEWVLMADHEPGYYDPEWMLSCSGCNEDHTAWPHHGKAY